MTICSKATSKDRKNCSRSQKCIVFQLLSVTLLVLLELHLGTTDLVRLPATRGSSNLVISSTAMASILPPNHACNSLECSLNGCFVHEIDSCQCRKPWSGSSCSILLTQPSPPSAKSLFHSEEDENTWSGPIQQDPETNLFHMYMAVYPKGNLARPNKMYHGVSNAATGPYAWNDMNLPIPNKSNAFANPGFLDYVNPTTGKRQYALFCGNQVLVEDTLYGNFSTPIAKYPYFNFSPTYHNQSIYAVYQHLNRVFETKDLKEPWAEKGKIRMRGYKEMSLEDPHLWIDEFHHWHIIAHSFDKGERYNCSQSMVSAHLYSIDGTEWHRSNEPPYGHTIHYTDGNSQIYSTLERPYVIFADSTQKQRPTHIVLAASLEHGDEGCAHTEQCAAKSRFCSCVNCKWIGRAGTVVLRMV